MSLPVAVSSLKYTLHRSVKIDYGLKLHEDYTAAVSPPKSIEYYHPKIKLRATDLQKCHYHNSLEISHLNLPYLDNSMLNNC